jgi:hypothetical protein
MVIAFYVAAALIANNIFSIAANIHSQIDIVIAVDVIFVDYGALNASIGTFLAAAICYCGGVVVVMTTVGFTTNDLVTDIICYIAASILSFAVISIAGMKMILAASAGALFKFATFFHEVFFPVLVSR